MKFWAFNQRVLSDQTVWVEGATLAEAKENLEAKDIAMAGDHTVVWTTSRRTPDEDTDETVSAFPEGFHR